MNWYTYLLKCSDGTFYTGMTNNLEKRLKTHNSKRGARYTAQRVPVELVWYEIFPDQSGARKREWEVRDWRREKKLGLIEDFKQRNLLLTKFVIPKEVLTP